MKLINLDKLDRLCKGDENKRIKYLEQYIELISSSVMRIEIALKQMDKKVLAKEIHYIQPQLIFFGMNSIFLANIQGETNENLISRMNKILDHIKSSILEIEKILQNIKSN